MVGLRGTKIDSAKLRGMQLGFEAIYNDGWENVPTKASTGADSHVVAAALLRER